MLHADMMQLLSEVYKGKINDASTTLNEYGGEKKEAQVVPGGLMIAAVNQVGFCLIVNVDSPLTLQVPE